MSSSTRSVVMPLPVLLGASWHQFGLGGRDPSMRRMRDECLRAHHTPDGPATTHVKLHRGEGDHGVVRAEVWGPGRGWVLDRLPDLVGAHDDLTGWDPTQHEVIARYARRDEGRRIVRGGRVEDVLFVTILGQKVTGYENARGWFGLVRMHGSDAPGPGGLRLPPTASTLASIPDWDYRSVGIEHARADRMRTAARRIDWLEEAVHMDREAAHERLTALPGLGVWTASIVERMALGDADAIELGDYHLPSVVSWNLAGEDRADDDRMAELLAPFRPHRGRALLLIEAHGRGKPRYGARMSPGTLSSPTYRTGAHRTRTNRW